MQKKKKEQRDIANKPVVEIKWKAKKSHLIQKKSRK